MSTILITDFVLVLLIAIRVYSAFAASPIYGHSAIPELVKIFLAIVLSYIIFLTIDKTNIHIDLNLVNLIVLGAREVITGMVMGFMLNFVFWGISFSGTLIGFDMGLMMAEAFNPMEEISENVIGQFINFAAIIVFFLINGHHYLIQGLVYSFTVVPIGKFTINGPVYELLIKYSFSVFVIAIKIAAPILVSFFLIQIAEGILARVMPQIQIVFVTQPLKIGLGFLLLVLSAPIYLYVIKILLKQSEEGLYTIIKAMGS